MAAATKHTLLQSATPGLHPVSIYQMAPPEWGSRHLITPYYSLIGLRRMKGCVGLVGLLVADSLPMSVVTHQLQVERRTGKVRRPKTDILSLCHATKVLAKYLSFRAVAADERVYCYSGWFRRTWAWHPCYRRWTAWHWTSDTVVCEPAWCVHCQPHAGSARPGELSRQ